MALSKCKECGHDVSTKADACPNCGYVIRKLVQEVKVKKQTSGCAWIALVVVGFILFGIIKSAMEEFEDTNVTPPSIAVENPATVSTPDDIQMTYYATRNVNVRSGPGTNFDVVTGLKQGAAIRCFRHNAILEWKECEDNRFVYRKYLSVQKPLSTSNRNKSGLGISRSQIQSLYSQPSLGFKFRSAPLADGTPRLMGTSPNEEAVVELIGPPTNLTEIGFMISTPPNRPEVLALNSVYLLGGIKNAFPEWPGVVDWTNSNLAKMGDGKDRRVKHGQKTLKLSSNTQLGLVFATISAN